MEANELRIGNYFLNHHKEIDIVTDLTFQKFRCQKIDGDFGIYPIPLTEEWLLKFGFVQFPASNLWDKEDFWAIYKKVNTDEWRCDHLEMQFKYVHQLQNLYFALTGNELEINYDTSTNNITYCIDCNCLLNHIAPCKLGVKNNMGE